jgi:hypothetical protein
MRLEQVPLFVGVIVAILGVGLVLDAQLPEGLRQSRERRRRERAERDRPGETLVGLGIIGLAAALIGRDTWRFGTLAVLGGAVLLGIGAWRNREYLHELVAFRGPARRGEKRHEPRRAAPAGGTAEASTVNPVIVPGLADGRPPRTPNPIRGDREAPIMTATDGVARPGKSVTEDTPPDGQPRLRIR